MNKRFSLRYKLILIFGFLIALATTIEGLLAVYTARKAVTEKVEAHLIDKATDVAEIIDGRITAFFQFLEGIARMPVLTNTNVSYADKMAQLKLEAAFNAQIVELNIVDMQGNRHSSEGTVFSVSDRDWFKTAFGGGKFVMEPYISRATNKMIITLSVPVYDDNRNIIGVLAIAIEAKRLSAQINDITVGKTGYCYILDETGTIIAHKLESLVTEKENAQEIVKTDSSLKSVADFEKMAVEIDEPSIGFYEYNGISNIASYATMKTTDWTIIIKAPKDEFMGTVNTLRIAILITSISILLISLVIVYFIALVKVRPIQNSIPLLAKIADGDFTVRLPVHGNNEITGMFEHLNETISKIGSSIKSVGDGSKVMQSIGDELSSNMTETASAINEITSNIDGVKQQTMNQAASVTETSSTVEEIIRTIEQLNGSIETQAASVAQSSASIEEMVANIASITQSLEKSDNMVKMLSTATSEGKTTLLTSNTVTQKIADESGGCGGGGEKFRCGE